MWVRFNQPFEGNPVHAVADVSYETCTQLVDLGIAGRCTGPNGVSFEEAAPEEVQTCIAQDQTPPSEIKYRQGYYW